MGEQSALDIAVGLGEQLVREAIWDDDRATWLGDDLVPLGTEWVLAHRSVDGSLYGGTAGIAMFLAPLAVTTGDPAVQTAARGALAHAQDWVRRTRPTGALYSGSLGVAASVAQAATLWGDAELLRRATDLTMDAMEHLPAAVDLIAGRAGSILGLLELARVVDLPEAADVALGLGRELAGLARRIPGGGCWWASDIGADEPPLCGLAHGASGVALALAELGIAFGDPTLIEIASEATDFERSWYSPENRNWPDLRELTREKAAQGQQPAWPEYWCHGSLGIGMARLRLYDITRRPVYGAELGVSIDAALGVLTAVAASPDDSDLSLCHGLGGAVDLLLEAGRVLERPGLVEAAKTGALAVAADRDPAVPWGCGVNGGGENPSMMVGLAGIGIMYLRIADVSVPAPCAALSGGAMPDRVIVQFERPVERDRLTQRVADVRTLVPGSTVVRVSPRGRLILLLGTGTDVARAVAEVGALDDVEYAEPDVVDHATPVDEHSVEVSEPTDVPADQPVDAPH